MYEGEVRMTVFENARGLRYAELFAVGSEWIEVYNSTGLSEAPPELWDTTDPERAAGELGAQLVVKNGPHWWAFDSATLRFAVDDVTVQGIGYRWCARLPAFLAKSGKLEPPFYTVVEANKEGELRYEAGKPVYELVSPDGGVFVMQGSSIDPSEYAALGDTLTLGDGWQFRIRTLDEDLAVSLDGKVKVVMDDFKNVYNLPVEAREDEEPEEEGVDKPLAVMIAIYPGPESARKDFEAFTGLVETGTIESDGIVLVTRDAAGKVQTEEGGPHRRGLRRFVAGRLTKGVAEAMDEKLPQGAAGIVAVYDNAHAAEAGRALGNAMTSSVGHLDKATPKELKAGLEQAQSRLG
jgi:hypothetical protein